MKLLVPAALEKYGYHGGVTPLVQVLLVLGNGKALVRSGRGLFAAVPRLILPARSYPALSSKPELRRGKPYRM